MVPEAYLKTHQTPSMYFYTTTLANSTRFRFSLDQLPHRFVPVDEILRPAREIADGGLVRIEAQLVI